jgi:hypothetical protein
MHVGQIRHLSPVPSRKYRMRGKRPMELLHSDLVLTRGALFPSLWEN